MQGHSEDLELAPECVSFFVGDTLYSERVAALNHHCKMIGTIIAE